MAVTVSGTSITFNDATVQTTAPTAPTTAQVLAATAGLTAGGVGTYAFVGIASARTFGTNYTGMTFVSLYQVPCSSFAYVQTGAASGTWKWLGATVSSFGNQMGLSVRVA